MHEWFNENELRSYPIREDALQETVDGVKLPQGILADLSVTIDADDANDLYISSISVSPGLVSVAVSLTGTPPIGVLIGTYESPEPHVPYKLEPMSDRVSGFVVFGSRAIVAAREVYRFAGVAASKLEEKTIRPFETPPVWSLGKEGDTEATPLTDIIKMLEGNDIEIRRDGNKIYVGLREGVRAHYVGPCDRIIDYITCGRPPLREINGVGPDGSGKITIEVR